MPALVAALLRRARAAGSWPRPRRRSAGGRRRARVQASTALRVSTSTTASWKRAATSATGTGSPSPLAGLDPAGDRGLEPGEGEVVAVLAQVARRRSGRAGTSTYAGSPVLRRAVDVRAARERQAEHAGPPCRTPRPRRRRWWRRAARTSPVTSSTSSSDECPPETSSAMARLRQRAVLELVDGDVRGQVVDAVQRLAERRARAPWRRRRRPAARR